MYNLEKEEQEHFRRKIKYLSKRQIRKDRFVLETFVEHGAPEEILYENKPHIGTDLLRNVVAGIREEIRSLGGDVRFEAKVNRFCDPGWKINRADHQ